ncbi:MAG: CCA tRNA nucleotidyltransferase [Pseudomonadota bacterium]
MACIPPRVHDLLEALRGGGFTGYLVGGAVRDLLLGKTPGDLDLVTDAPLETLVRLFGVPAVRTVGKTFRVCLVDGIEIAASRAQGQDFPEADLERRDLTINAMALDPYTGRIVDPFSGQADLEKKQIRFTRDPNARILEDPLRMIRACRFVSGIGGTLDPASAHAIRSLGPRVFPQVPGERIRMEILKAMVHLRPSLFFRALGSVDLLDAVLPSLGRCMALDGGPHHGETVFDHCMMVGDALSSRRPLLRLAGFLHDAGKYDAADTAGGSISFYGHETCDLAILSDLEVLRFSTWEREFISSIIRVHMRPLNPETTPRAARRLLSFLGENKVTVQDFMRMRIADKRSNLAKKPYSLSDLKLRLGILNCELERSGTALEIRDLELSGRDVMAVLGVSRGPVVGRCLGFLLERVLDDPSLNTADALTSLLKENRGALIAGD